MQWGKFMTQVCRISDKQGGDFFTSNSMLECEIWKMGAESALKAAGVADKFMVKIVEPEIVQILPSAKN